MHVDGTIYSALQRSTRYAGNPHPKPENSAFDFTRRYRPDIYHKAFSMLVSACLDNETSTPYLEQRPPIGYIKPKGPSQTYKLKQQGRIGYDHLISGKMIPVYDEELREKDVYGWAAFQDEDLEILKTLDNKLDIELPIWTSLRGQLWNGVHFVRPKGDTEAAILPVQTNGSSCFYEMGDVPSNLNLLVASAQKLARDQIRPLP